MEEYFFSFDRQLTILFPYLSRGKMRSGFQESFIRTFSTFQLKLYLAIPGKYFDIFYNILTIIQPPSETKLTVTQPRKFLTQESFLSNLVWFHSITVQDKDRWPNSFLHSGTLSPALGNSQAGQWPVQLMNLPERPVQVSDIAIRSCDIRDKHKRLQIRQPTESYKSITYGSKHVIAESFLKNWNFESISKS